MAPLLGGMAPALPYGDNTYGNPDSTCLQNPQWQQESQISTQIPHCCIRVMDQDMALGNSPGLRITVARRGNRAIHISLFLIASSDLPFSPAHEAFPFSFFPTSPPCTHASQWCLT